MNEPKYLNLFGAWNVRCRVNQQVQHYEKFLKMECQDRGELFALWTALGNITMEQSGSILVGSTPISDFNADGVGDFTITTTDEDINWD